MLSPIAKTLVITLLGTFSRVGSDDRNLFPFNGREAKTVLRLSFSGQEKGCKSIVSHIERGFDDERYWSKPQITFQVSHRLWALMWLLLIRYAGNLSRLAPDHQSLSIAISITDLRNFEWRQDRGIIHPHPHFEEGKYRLTGYGVGIP